MSLSDVQGIVERERGRRWIGQKRSGMGAVVATTMVSVLRWEAERLAGRHVGYFPPGPHPPRFRTKSEWGGKAVTSNKSMRKGGGQHGSPVELELTFGRGIGAPLSPEPMPRPKVNSNLHPNQSRRALRPHPLSRQHISKFRVWRERGRWGTCSTEGTQRSES